MPVLRELITRFGFEVDEKGAKDVEKRVDGMKKGIGGLGKLLGVSFGVAGAKALFTIGQRAARAEFNLKRLAGTNFTGLRSQFKDVQDELNNIREGAGKVVTERQFDIAAAGFLKVFGKGKDQVNAFGQLFSFAAKQAVITGEEVTTIIEQIQSGIQGGGFEALLELPGFDIFQKQLLEFQQQAIDPGEPGGRIALQNRLKAIMGIVTEAAEGQNTALKQVPGVLLETDKLAAKTKNTFDQLAKTVNESLVPAIGGLNLVVAEFNKLITGAETGETQQKFARKIFGFALADGAGKTGAGKEDGGIFSRISGFLNKPIGQVAKDIRGGGEGGVVINNSFPVQPGTDPVAIGREVNRVLQSQLVNAKRSIVKIEE